jgi:hypothetical protein
MPASRAEDAVFASDPQDRRQIKMKSSRRRDRRVASADLPALTGSKEVHASRGVCASSQPKEARHHVASANCIASRVEHAGSEKQHHPGIASSAGALPNER